MADGDEQLRYVKLNKNHGPVEINPGELNQPIQVPQLNVRTCDGCGQSLPESFEPPAIEPWTTGIFGCTEDRQSCYTGLFCPCVLFGRNYESVRDDYASATTPCVLHAIFIEGGLALAATMAAFHGIIDPTVSYYICEGLLFSWWMCGTYTGFFREMLQKKYHLENAPCDPCMVHCCLHWCALCQEHREMKGRLSDNFVMPMTLVNAPRVQQMNSAEDGQGPSSATSSSVNGHEHHTTLEMQAL
uniref:cell number regulator 6-like n=1 Tax=Erigeron canadensis TaxID=72917 RepID=UPI001CB8F9A5|nr:cell number regulator 6-like [Erigeron canadensis]XP_043617033.1 cell number regulator 6-like [Erigeron canadensis]